MLRVCTILTLLRAAAGDPTSEAEAQALVKLTHLFKRDPAAAEQLVASAKDNVAAPASPMPSPTTLSPMSPTPSPRTPSPTSPTPFPTTSPSPSPFAGPPLFVSTSLV